MNPGKMKIEYCPTLYMIGDYFTKPLHGSFIHNFRNLILGIEKACVPMYNTKSIYWIK